MIGVNPATDSVETVRAILDALDRLIETYDIPTQGCCLAHITTQLAALERGRASRSALSIDRRDGSREPQFWNHARNVARRPRRRCSNITEARTSAGKATT